MNRSEKKCLKWKAKKIQHMYYWSSGRRRKQSNGTKAVFITTIQKTFRK